MKYKVGDKVKIREDLKSGRIYYMDGNNVGDAVVYNMLKLAGKVVTIKNNDYKYNIEEMGYSWTDEMFEGLASTKTETKMEENNMFKIKSYKVIEDKVIVVEFSDGDVQKSVCMPGDEFDYERGLEVCIMKHLLGGKAKYHKVLKSAQKQIEELGKQAIKAEKEAKEKERKIAKEKARKEARDKRKKAERISEMKTAYLLALQEYNGDVDKVIESVESK